MRYRFVPVLIIISWLITGPLKAQVIDSARIDSIMNAHILGGDSIPHVELDEVSVRPPRVFKNRRDARRYWRLVYNLKKVMPYAKIISGVVAEVDKELGSIQTDKERRKFIKQTEKTLWCEYEKDMRKMTISQGRLLFKLVDRETSKTTYYWIEHYRGKVSAFFWQGIARLFSSNLKTGFDSAGDDRLIEELIHDIEKGLI